MPGRKFASNNLYRYGFNGKENDNEMEGEGGEQDYGMRIYDTRLGRFLSVDPLTEKYPELTPFQFASNRPIDGIDLDGQEWWKYILPVVSPVLAASTDKEVSEGFTERARNFAHGLKNLPRALKQLLDANTPVLGTAGLPIIQANEKKRMETMTAFAKGGVAFGKELWDLTKKAWNGDKRAQGALIFEALLILTPEAGELGGVLKGLSYAGKVGKCVEYASEFGSKVEPMINGIGGTVQRFEINIGKDGLIGTATQQLTDNGMHQFSVVTTKEGAEIVFDNLHPEGILKNEYMESIAGFTKEGKHLSGQQLLDKAKIVLKKTSKKK